MNSPFANIFLAMQAHILAEVPEIKFVDLDLGQLEGFSVRPAVPFPLCLLDFKGWSFENLSDNNQTAEGNVIVKIGFAQFNSTGNLTDPLWKEGALEYFDLEWKINKALHGWSPGAEFGYLTRTFADGENKPAGIRVRPLTYRLEFEDNSTVVTQQTTPTPSPNFAN